jgi:hypothetical protein
MMFPILPAAALAALLGTALATPAFAGSEYSLSGTTIRLQDTTQRGAVAEVAFDNRAVNGPADDSTFPLDRGDVGIQVTFLWNTNRDGDDEIVIETDPAHVAVPRRLTVAEGQIGTAYVYPLDGVGF